MPGTGIYRSNDGGETWIHLGLEDSWHIGEIKTGSNDIVISQSNPDVLYASMWENYPGFSGKNSGIYKSIDAGKTWSKLNGGLPQGEGIGRIGLAVSNTNPDKIYALLDHRSKKKNVKPGI